MYRHSTPNRSSLPSVVGATGLRKIGTSSVGSGNPDTLSIRVYQYKTISWREVWYRRSLRPVSSRSQERVLTHQLHAFQFDLPVDLHSGLGCVTELVSVRVRLQSSRLWSVFVSIGQSFLLRLSRFCLSMVLGILQTLFLCLCVSLTEFRTEKNKKRQISQNWCMEEGTQT